MIKCKNLISASLIFLMGHSTFAKEFNPSLRLISKSLTEEFILKLNQTQEIIKHSKSKIIEKTDEWQRINKLEEKIIQVCGDHDFDDEIIVNQSTPTSSIVSLTCYEDNSTQKASAFILNIQNQNELVEISEIEAYNVDSIKKNNLNVSSEKIEKKITMVLRESLALTTSTVLSIRAANLVYPGRLDSPKHAGISAIISSIGTSMAYHFLKFSPKKSGQFGFGLCLLVGAGKEWYDSKHPDKHQADWNDFFADSIGCASGAGLVTWTLQF